jgi:hypothetical protein
MSRFVARGVLFAINGEKFNFAQNNNQPHVLLLYVGGMDDGGQSLQDVYALEGLNATAWTVRQGDLAGADKVKMGVIEYT